MNIQSVAVSAIVPYAKNAKKHDKKQVKNIAESIKQYGRTQPLVLDKNNEIVIGHGRFFAAQQLKLKEVPCVYVSDLSPEQVKALRIADNKLNEAPWDIDLLREEIADLDFGSIELDFDELDDPGRVREDDYEPVLPEEPRSKLGFIYQLGRHRVMCGDSTILTDVEKLMDGAKADMLLTDPPYNVALGTGGMYQTVDGHSDHEVKENGAFLLNDDLPDEEFRQFLTDALSNAQTVMKRGAAFHIWHADTQRYSFELAIRNAGLKQRQCLIWVKDQHTLSRQDFQWQHEPCLYGENMLPYPQVEEYEVGDEHESCSYGWVDGSHYWFKNRKQTTVLFFDRPKASKEHPTMKPVTLFDYEMKCNSLVGENILDLFAGSGTTVIAAEQNGRNAFCMEYDPKFVDVIVDRWESFTGEKAVLLNGADNYIEDAK